MFKGIFILLHQYCNHQGFLNMFHKVALQKIATFIKCNESVTSNY